MLFLKKALRSICGNSRTESLRTQKARFDPERKMREFYSQFVRIGELCFDVGANAGNRTKAFLALGARVIAVEPQSACVDMLQKVYDPQRRLTIVPKALAPTCGEAVLHICNAHTISSLSAKWIDVVRNSGRFSEHVWNITQRVETTTLDVLIEAHGVPSFVKIDVEGFELQVLQGLTRPVPSLSFEFVPEYLATAFECIERLASLGSYEFNYSLGESMTFALDAYVPAFDIIRRLEVYRDDISCFGDVYARLSGDRREHSQSIEI